MAARVGNGLNSGKRGICIPLSNDFIRVVGIKGKS